MITSIVRTAILYVFITLGIRLMGKRQIGDMQPNELVITLLISEIAALPLQDSTQPLLFGIIAIFVLIILEIAVSVLSMKNIFIRKLLNGKSIVIIKDGVIAQQAMSEVRMTVVDLIELLRGQNVFDISTVVVSSAVVISTVVVSSAVVSSLVVTSIIIVSSSVVSSLVVTSSVVSVVASVSKISKNESHDTAESRRVSIIQIAKNRDIIFFIVISFAQLIKSYYIT